MPKEETKVLTLTLPCTVLKLAQSEQEKNLIKRLI